MIKCMNLNNFENIICLQNRIDNLIVENVIENCIDIKNLINKLNKITIRLKDKNLCRTEI